MWTSRTLHPVKTRKVLPKSNFGLYRGNGLALLGNLNGQETDKVRKNIIRVFEDIGFSLEIETNLKEVDFSDISLILQNGTFWPYSDPNIVYTFIVYQTTYQTS